MGSWNSKGESEQGTGESCRKRACPDDLRKDYVKGAEHSVQLASSAGVPCNKKTKHDAPAGQDQRSCSSSGSPKQSGNECREAITNQRQAEPRGRARKRSSKRSRLRSPERDTSTEIQEPRDTETIIHYKCNNFYLTQSPLTFGDSTGNAFNYDLSAKLYGTKEGTRDDDQTRNLLETIRGLVEAKEPRMTSLEDICRECDAATVGVEKGCVKVTFRFKSKDGLQRFWAKYSSGELQQRLKADLPIGKVEMSADDYTRGCEFFEGSGRGKKQAQMHSQPDSRLSLDLVQNAIAKYVRHREKTLKVLLAWAQDYANPWAKLTKVIRALVPVLWVSFFLIEVLSWLYQSDESYHEETSVVAVSVIFGVVSQIVTLCMFDLRLSHFYLRSAVLGVVTMATGGFWALSLSVMDSVKVSMCIGVMITPVIMEKTGLRQSSLRLAPGAVAGLLCGCILVVAFFESVTKSMCLLAMVALTRYYIAGKPFTDPKPVVLQDVMATLHLKNVLETVYTLETVVKEEHLQLRCRETPGLSILKSTVTTKRQNPNSLFSIVELPEDIVSSISSAIRILKIPNSEVVKFVKDFADKFECRNSERAMKIEYYRLREEIAIS